MFLETGSESPVTNIYETGPEETDTNCTVSGGRGGGDRGRAEEMAVPDTPSQLWSRPWGPLCCPSNRALEDGPTHSPAAMVTAGKNHSPTSEGVLDLRERALLPSPFEGGLAGVGGGGGECRLLEIHSTMATPPSMTAYCSLRAFLSLLMVSFPFSAWAGKQFAYCFL